MALQRVAILTQVQGRTAALRDATGQLAAEAARCKAEEERLHRCAAVGKIQDINAALMESQRAAQDLQARVEAVTRENDSLRLAAGEAAEAVALHRRALATYEADPTTGKDHAGTASCAFYLAAALRELLATVCEEDAPVHDVAAALREQAAIEKAQLASRADAPPPEACDEDAAKESKYTNLPVSWLCAACAPLSH